MLGNIRSSNQVLEGEGSAGYVHRCKVNGSYALGPPGEEPHSHDGCMRAQGSITFVPCYRCPWLMSYIHTSEPFCTYQESEGVSEGKGRHCSQN